MLASAPRHWATLLRTGNRRAAVRYGRIKCPAYRTLRPRAFLIEAEQAFQDFIIGEAVGAPVGPAVGASNGTVEVAVGVVEPGRALVVEIG